MWEYWKKDITRAIVIAIIVAIAGIIINWVRTPVFNVMAANGTISRARARELKGLNLIDNWAHEGWPEVSRNTPVENGELDGQEPAENGPVDYVTPIDTFEAKEMYDSGDCIFFDARGQEYYEEGHIAGAYNWPSDMFDMYYEIHKDKINPDDCIVVYCIGGACDESYHLGISLSVEGYTNVYLYEGGIQEWEFSGFPVNEGPEP
jgi:rhodanese-related sulfurtransferase